MAGISAHATSATGTSTAAGLEPVGVGFDRLGRLIREQFGIQLEAEKQALVEARLRSLMKQRGYATIDEYVRAELADPSAEALSELVNRISTNHTFFYREAAHFALFERLLPGWISAKAQAGNRDLRIWSAASSSGEEPYLLAMLIVEALGAEAPRWKAGVLATDISQKVLDVAQTGVYGADNVARLPEKFRRRWFTRDGADTLRVKEALRKEVAFRRLNLMRPRFPFRAPFDAIFCRNVMIYFDAPTREAVTRRLKHHLAIGGVLFLGHSETLPPRVTGLKMIQPSAYRRVA